jgi:hypothetical protein
MDRDPIIHSSCNLNNVQACINVAPGLNNEGRSGSSATADSISTQLFATASRLVWLAIVLAILDKHVSIRDADPPCPNNLQSIHMFDQILGDAVLEVVSA